MHGNFINDEPLLIISGSSCPSYSGKCIKWYYLLEQQNYFMVYFVKSQSYISTHNSYLACMSRFAQSVTLRPGERFV